MPPFRSGKSRDYSRGDVAGGAPFGEGAAFAGATASLSPEKPTSRKGRGEMGHPHLLSRRWKLNLGGWKPH